MEYKNIKPLISPETVAVIGASRRPESVGQAIFSNILLNRYKGVIYPVNPNARGISGVPCYPSIGSVPAQVDLAVVIVPSKSVAQVLEECGQAKVKSAIVVSAGFKEIGSEGAELENEVKTIAEKYGILLMGPNCLGVINTDPEIMLNASFATTMPKTGKIAFISQSGALCTAVLDYAKGENIGFSKFVSLGNKAMVNELDWLRALKDDPHTDVILLYLEDLVDGRAFIDMAREITGEMAKTKPILAIKSGRTQAGAKAAFSHTGSMAGSDEVYDAVFSQAGVLRVDSVQELFDFARAFASQPLPSSNRVAIVTNAGGPGIMATDACVRYGLELAKLEPATEKNLKKSLPPQASVTNPVDLMGDARHDRYQSALQHVLRDPGVSGVITVVTPQAMTDIREIAKVVAVSSKDNPGKTVLACFMGVVDVSPGIKVLEEEGIPHFRFPESSARTLAAMHSFTQWMKRPRTSVKTFNVKKEQAKNLVQRVLKEKRRILKAEEAFELLECYGLPLVPWAAVNPVRENHSQTVNANGGLTSPSSQEGTRTQRSSLAFSNGVKNTNTNISTEDVKTQAQKIGYPVALKINSPELVHKSEARGVILNIKNETDLTAACQEIITNFRSHAPQGKLAGLVIQAMASQAGKEVILGIKRHPQFGPVLMFGMGGIYVEVFKDVTFRLAPIRELGAKHMIESIRAYKLLEGVRHEPKADLSRLEECLQRLSQLAVEIEEVQELDINPLMVFPEGKGCAVVDVRAAIE